MNLLLGIMMTFWSFSDSSHISIQCDGVNAQVNHVWFTVKATTIEGRTTFYRLSDNTDIRVITLSNGDLDVDYRYGNNIKKVSLYNGEACR